MFEIKDLTKSLGTFKLGPINLSVAADGYCVILGPSGAGKSQLLYLLAGLTKADNGLISLQGEQISKPNDYIRTIGMLFQQYALFPHMTVQENIFYGLKAQKRFTKNSKQQALAWMEELEIGHLKNRHVQWLSGGEQQRIALARTLVLEPRILLLDEPLAAIDVPFRRELRTVLKRIHQNGILVIHVTHDYEEALALASDVAIMEQGNIVAFGKPDKVFNQLNTSFIARLIGEVNMYDVIHKGSEQGLWLWQEKYSGRIIKSLPFRSNGFGKILIRANDIVVANEPFSASAQNMMRGMVKACLPTLGGMQVTVDAGILFHLLLSENAMRSLEIKPGKEVFVAFKASAVQQIG
jgi:ABC-type Fe3+/spermidine/putrescine transport system ATPase subunit